MPGKGQFFCPTGKKEKSRKLKSVSLTSFPGKTEERSARKLLTVTQWTVVTGGSLHGFTKGKPCLTNLVAFYDETTGRVDEGQAVDVICLDFCKAFDSFSDNILLNKLASSGLDR